MTNDIARPGDNPWLSYGNAAAARTIVGDLLKFSKGEFVAGTADDLVPIGTRLAAVMDSLTIGWIKWQGNRPAEQRMGAIAEGFQPAARKELGDTDQDEWETDGEGAPRDPWQFSNYLIMVGQGTDKLYTFTTSSRGGLGAIGELSKAYGKAMRQRPNEYPVVELDVGSYQHSIRSYGRIKFPIFRIVDWTAKDACTKLLTGGEGSESTDSAELPAPEAASPTAAKPKAKVGARGVDTSIPF
jgi:hypothetical protein